ncbi:MAG TPA: hypothetical protein PLB60_06140 [Candidatus Marinimicrobia bacterium]|nr:hypothetical protein [Candidatus Neomarinimicrobiota bacterium]
MSLVKITCESSSLGSYPDGSGHWFESSPRYKVTQSLIKRWRKAQGIDY